MGTSRLQSRTVKELDRVFGCFAVKENSRPEWLVSPSGSRLELDIYIPSAKIAVEVQGLHHYQFTPYFHGDANGFQKQLEADKQKLAICQKRGIRFFEVASESDLREMIFAIRKTPARPDPKHTQYQREQQEQFHKSVIRRYAEARAAECKRNLEAARVLLAEEIARETPETFLSWDTAQPRLYAESQVERLERKLAEVTKKAESDFHRRNKPRRKLARRRRHQNKHFNRQRFATGRRAA